MSIKLHERSGQIREAVGDAKDRTRRIKIIAAGPGSSAYYPAEVLERDGAIAFPSGTPWTTKSYANHPTMDEEWTQPERDVTKIVAKQVSQAEWDEESQALYADFQFSKKFYEEVVEEFDDVLGMSIYAMGEAVKDDYGNPAILTVGEYTGTVLERLLQDRMNSVDVVTVAGAGGAIMPKLTEAMKPFVQEGKAETQPSAPKKETPKMDEEKLATLLAEKLGSVIATATATAVAEALKPAEVDPEVLDVATVAEAVAASGLSEPSRKRVYEAIKAPGTKVEEAIKAQKDFETEVEEAIKARLAESEETYGGSGSGASDWSPRGYAGVSK